MTVKPNRSFSNNALFLTLRSKPSPTIDCPTVSRDKTFPHFFMLGKSLLVKTDVLFEHQDDLVNRPKENHNFCRFPMS